MDSQPQAVKPHRNKGGSKMEDLIAAAADGTSSYMKFDIFMRIVDRNLEPCIMFVDHQLKRATIIIIIYLILSNLVNIIALCYNCH